MGHAENWATAQINFEAGKIYFLNQDIRMGVWMARTGYSPLTAADALREINEIDYRVYDTAHPGEDMSQKDFQDVKEDIEKEVKEDPGRHKDVLDYRGYNKL